MRLQMGSAEEWQSAKLRLTMVNLPNAARTITWYRMTVVKAMRCLFKVGCWQPQRRQSSRGPKGMIRRCSTQQRTIQKLSMPSRCGANKARTAPQVQTPQMVCSFFMAGVLVLHKSIASRASVMWHGLSMNSPFFVLILQYRVRTKLTTLATPAIFSRRVGSAATEGLASYWFHLRRMYMHETEITRIRLQWYAAGIQAWHCGPPYSARLPGVRIPYVRQCLTPATNGSIQIRVIYTLQSWVTKQSIIIIIQTGMEPLLKSRSSVEDNVYDVIIVGAGISGLTAAKILLKEGKSVLVFDANTYCGGAIKGAGIADLVHSSKQQVEWLDKSKEAGLTELEIGASEISSAHTFMINLAEELDLTLFNQYQDGRFIYGESQDNIQEVSSVLDIYFSEQYKKTMSKLLTKIENISKNIKEAHENIANNPSKKYYEDLFKEYIQTFDTITVKDFLEKELSNEKLRKLVINEFEIVESISVDHISMMQVLLHGYGLENFKRFVNKQSHKAIQLRIKEGSSELIKRLQQKIEREEKKMGLQKVIHLSEAVLEIKNEINNDVEVITAKGCYRCFKVFFSGSLGKSSKIKISKLSAAKRLIFTNQQEGQMIKIFLIFESAFWRAKYSGSGIFSEDFPFSEMADQSPSNLSCGILSLIICGNKVSKWRQKFKEKDRPQELKTYLKSFIAKIFLKGNQEQEQLKTMIVLQNTMFSSIGYQNFTRKGICLELVQNNEDYLESYTRDEHNVIFMGSELSKKFGSYMEGALRHTRQKLFRYLEFADPWAETL